MKHFLGNLLSLVSQQPIAPQTMSRKGRDLVLSLVDEIRLYLEDTFFLLFEVDFKNDHECLHEVLFNEIQKIHLNELVAQHRLTPLQQDYLMQHIHWTIRQSMKVVEDSELLLESKLEMRMYLLRIEKPERPAYVPQQLCFLGTLDPVPWKSLREEDKLSVQDFIFNMWESSGDHQVPMEFAAGDERFIVSYRLRSTSSMQDAAPVISAAAE